MSDVDFVLRERGESRELGAFVVAVRFVGERVAFGLGDGTLRLAQEGRLAREGWRAVEVHEGAVLAMGDDGAGWVTGGDDGGLRRTGLDGVVREVATFGSKWVEQVAGWGAGKAGVLACGVGKVVHVFDGGGVKLKELAHPSTVTGIAFDAKGKRIAASHYNGVTLWFVGAKVDSPRVLEWKGSHTGVALHPGGDAAVSTMQENSLHGWRLADGQHMRMSGYPAKTESLSFSRTGKWLASSGADGVVLWPFFGGGPMGKAPTELAGGEGMSCTRVAFHPVNEMVAAGFADGSVVLADVGSERILGVAGPGRGAVSALAWSASGTALAFGTETGFGAVVDLSKKD